MSMILYGSEAPTEAKTELLAVVESYYVRWTPDGEELVFAFQTTQTPDGTFYLALPAIYYAGDPRSKQLRALTRILIGDTPTNLIVDNLVHRQALISICEGKGRHDRIVDVQPDLVHSYRPRR